MIVLRLEYGTKYYNLEEMEFVEKHKNKIEIYFPNHLLTVSYTDPKNEDEFKNFVRDFENFLQNGSSVLEIPYKLDTM